MFFDIGNKQSVELDIQPDHRPSGEYAPNKGHKASVIVSLLDHLPIEYSPKSIRIPVVHRRTVGWYMDLVGDAVYYAFNSEGLGCRGWCHDMIERLVGQGEIGRAEGEAAQENMLYLWPSGEFLPHAEGVVYYQV